MLNRFSKKLSGFAELSDDDLAALERATADPKTIAPRKDLIREGDKPAAVLVVLEGWACRYKILPNGGRQIMAFLLPGDACDFHVGLLNEMDHGIQTITEVKLATIPSATMGQLFARTGIARALYIAQLVDEGTLRAWIVSMGRRTSTERIAHLLLELHIRAVNVGAGEPDTMRLPLSQLVLADALGMTSVHVNRILQTLRQTQAIELSRGVLHIVDAAALTRLAGFDDSYLHRRLSISS